MWSRHEFLGARERAVVGGIMLSLPSRCRYPTLSSYIRNKRKLADRIEDLDLQIEKLSWIIITWALQSDRGRQKSVKKKRQKKKRQKRFEAWAEINTASGFAHGRRWLPPSRNVWSLGTTLAESWGNQSYNCKELISANNIHKQGHRFCPTEFDL